MQDFYLKFKDKAEADSVIYEGDTPRFTNVDVIGEIPDVDGWHVNVRVVNEDGSVLDDYKVNPEPSTPIRVWA